jgi:two-component system chemotaxis response regulator CheB
MAEKQKNMLVATSDESLRKFIAALAKDAGFAALRAATGESPADEALRFQPAVILLDADEDPEALAPAMCRIMFESPRPALLVTRDPEKSRGPVSNALALGAAGALNIPEGKSYSSLSDTQKDRMSRMLTNAASARVARMPVRELAARLSSMRDALVSETARRDLEVLQAHVNGARRFDIVGVAISTGGPNALGRFVPLLPVSFPAPILVVQHIIPGFLDGIVKRLNDSCEVAVRMAENGQQLEPGAVYFAPDKKHLTVARTPQKKIISKLSDQPEGLLFCPSADVMFKSMAAVAGARCLGVIMTGMGHDGVEGLAAIKKAGGLAVAQDQASSAIYGMARAAVDAAVVDHVFPLDNIAGEMYGLLFDSPSAPAST